MTVRSLRYLLLLICIPALVLAVCGCEPAAQQKTTAQPTPSKYDSDGRTGFARFSDLGKRFTDLSAAGDALPWHVARVGNTEGRTLEGVVLVERYGVDSPSLPEGKRPLFAFYRDYRVEQWPYDSPQEAKASLAAADTSAAVGMSTGRWGKVRGNDAYISDRITPDQDIDGSGRPSGMYAPESSIIWVEDAVLYKVSSEEGLSTGLLMKVAVSVTR